MKLRHFFRSRVKTKNSLLAGSSIAKQTEPRRAKKGNFWGHSEGICFLLLLVLLWVAVSSLRDWKSVYLFPSLPRIGKAFLQNGRLLQDTLSSVSLLLPAFLLAAALGIASGVLAGGLPWMHRLLKPFARLASPIPPNIYIPYAIVLFPTFRLAAGFVIFIAAFWPIFLNTTAGVLSLPEQYRENAATLGIGNFEFLWRIALMAALPHIFSGLSVGLGLSFIMLTVAELVGTNEGLGYFIQFKADYSEYDGMVAGIVYTSLLVFGLMELLEALRRRLLFWTKAN